MTPLGDFDVMHATKGKELVWYVWILVLVLLISFGITYRILASRLRLVVDTPIELPVLLDTLPTRINSWVGIDMPIAPNILRRAKNDATLKRLYTNEVDNHRINLYIAYTARPRTMLGHRPRICYVAAGWVHDSTQEVTIQSNAGRVIPCLLHRFQRFTPSKEEIIVLNFYIVNGELTSDEGVFSGVGWRTPNIHGDPARYVTQVQVSSIFEKSVRMAVEEMTDLILDFFPDEKGKVKVAEYIDAVGDTSK